MNIIVLCLDTFRADIVGEGQKLSHVATPNLDRLHGESAVFTRAFGEGQPTLQARRSFFTGMRSFPWRYNFDRRGHSHHASGWHKIPPDQDTISEILCARGYYTGLIADTYHMFKPTMNYTRGFCSWDFIRGQESDAWRGGTPEMVADQLAKHTRQPIDWKSNVGFLQYLWNVRGRECEEDYFIARVMSRASEWIEDNHRSAPFFLWIDAFDPHEPWDPPTEYADRYKPDYDGLDFIGPGRAGDNATQDEKERTAALYFGETTFADKWVGRVFDTLDRLKLWDDTIVVFTSDHGTQVYDDGRTGKNPKNLRAYNTRIPLFIRHPDGPRGQKIDGFVQAHDLAPTLLGMLDIPIECDGRDFWPMATAGADPIRDHIVIGWGNFSHATAQGYASVRDDRWNYIVGTGFDDPEPRLFDLQSDPEEKTNVVDDHPDVVAQQRRRVETVLKQPLPGVHEEVCSPGPTALDICSKHWFQGKGGPPPPGEK